ncbi:MAG: DinB family protein [Burkholderiales bacterium]|nr:DinB family protein [Burkholderiales bacterium]
MSALSSALSHLRLLAQYNAWMNTKVYDSAAKLPPQALNADRGAFFGSIIGTLNHLVVADTIWLKRFANHPARPAALEALRNTTMPAALNQILFPELPALRAHREGLDATINDWITGLTEADLEQVLRYANTKGVPAQKRFGTLLIHFFNHQTHHRGQLSTLLFQAGEDPGITDLLALIPDQGET